MASRPAPSAFPAPSLGLGAASGSARMARHIREVKEQVYAAQRSWQRDQQRQRQTSYDFTHPAREGYRGPASANATNVGAGTSGARLAAWTGVNASYYHRPASYSTPARRPDISTSGAYYRRQSAVGAPMPGPSAPAPQPAFPIPVIVPITPAPAPAPAPVPAPRVLYFPSTPVAQSPKFPTPYLYDAGAAGAGSSFASKYAARKSYRAPSAAQSFVLPVPFVSFPEPRLGVSGKTGEDAGARPDPRPAPALTPAPTPPRSRASPQSASGTPDRGSRIDIDCTALSRSVEYAKAFRDIVSEWQRVVNRVVNRVPAEKPGALEREVTLLVDELRVRAATVVEVLRALLRTCSDGVHIQIHTHSSRTRGMDAENRVSSSEQIAMELAAITALAAAMQRKLGSLVRILEAAAAAAAAAGERGREGLFKRAARVVGGVPRMLASVVMCGGGPLRFTAPSGYRYRYRYREGEGEGYHGGTREDEKLLESSNPNSSSNLNPQPMMLPPTSELVRALYAETRRTRRLAVSSLARCEECLHAFRLEVRAKSASASASAPPSLHANANRPSRLR